MLDSSYEDLSVEQIRENFINSVEESDFRRIQDILQKKLVDINGIFFPNSKKDIFNRTDTALIWAIRNTKSDLVKFLLNQGANPNAKNQFGNTPLHYAAQNPNESITTLLLSKGANLIDLDPKYHTPLQWSIVSSQFNISILLINHMISQGIDVLGILNHTEEEITLCKNETEKDLISLNIKFKKLKVLISEINNIKQKITSFLEAIKKLEKLESLVQITKKRFSNILTEFKGLDKLISINPFNDLISILGSIKNLDKINKVFLETESGLTRVTQVLELLKTLKSYDEVDIEYNTFQKELEYLKTYIVPEEYILYNKEQEFKNLVVDLEKIMQLKLHCTTLPSNISQDMQNTTIQDNNTSEDIAIK